MKNNFTIMVIGGSAGSLSVVLELLPHMKKTMMLAIVMVFHRKDNEDNTLIDILSHKTEFGVKEIEDKEQMLPNMVYVAPADYHILLEKDGSFSLDHSEKVNYCRPSIDVTFESVADVFADSMVAVLLSGANADGVNGLKVVKHNGGLVVVQDPADAEVPYMPKQAIENIKVDIIFDSKSPQNLIGYLERKR